jgi:hypothetical protein
VNKVTVAAQGERLLYMNIEKQAQAKGSKKIYLQGPLMDDFGLGISVCALEEDKKDTEFTGTPIRTPMMTSMRPRDKSELASESFFDNKKGASVKSDYSFENSPTKDLKKINMDRGGTQKRSKTEIEEISDPGVVDSKRILIDKPMPSFGLEPEKKFHTQGSNQCVDEVSHGDNGISVSPRRSNHKSGLRKSVATVYQVDRINECSELRDEFNYSITKKSASSQKKRVKTTKSFD